MHMVDEASRLHVAEVLRTGENLDTHVLGSCSEDELMTHYMQAWVRYFGHPHTLHADADGGIQFRMVQKASEPPPTMYSNDLVLARHIGRQVLSNDVSRLTKDALRDLPSMISFTQTTVLLNNS